MDCKACKARFRADQLIEDFVKAKGETISVDGWNNDQMMEYIKENNVTCPECGKADFTDIRKFNLMFKTFPGRNGGYTVGALSPPGNSAGYLRKL